LTLASYAILSRNAASHCMRTLSLENAIVSPLVKLMAMYSGQKETWLVHKVPMLWFLFDQFYSHIHCQDLRVRRRPWHLNLRRRHWTQRVCTGDTRCSWLQCYYSAYTSPQAHYYY
jgi:hypothetical protein